MKSYIKHGSQKRLARLGFMLSLSSVWGQPRGVWSGHTPRLVQSLKSPGKAGRHRDGRYTTQAESSGRAAPREQANLAKQDDLELGSEVNSHCLLTLKVTHKWLRSFRKAHSGPDLPSQIGLFDQCTFCPPARPGLLWLISLTQAELATT